MHPDTTILGLTGSLRQQSYNRGLLHAARAVAPGHVAMQLFDLAALPLFNEDLERDGDPPAVRALKARIAAAAPC